MAKENVIGRDKEKALLDDYMRSGYPEFVAVYGRRRVGKTFLIREFFDGDFAFYMTGAVKTGYRKQLADFDEAIKRCSEKEYTPSADWRGAFSTLRDMLEKKYPAAGDEKKVIFFDELPWLDTKRSGFVQALAHFWNSWASTRRDILLIVCGSVTSWIINKIVEDRGSLHNRLTGQIALRPFTLSECEAYLRSMGIEYSRNSVTESYMIFGGVPYYLSLMKRRNSLVQNVDMLCFEDGAPLKNEFSRLYSSLFGNSEHHVSVVRALAGKPQGMTRNEIIGKTGIPKGGGLTKVLKELEQCSFLRLSRDYTKQKNGQYYLLSDAFTLFYLKFIEGNAGGDNRYWANNHSSGAVNAWRGFAYERVCFAHVDNIKRALGIYGVGASVSSWRSRRADPGAQIDLVIDRRDDTINLCEIKCAAGEYLLDKREMLSLLNRREAFAHETGTRKGLHLTMITTNGVRPGMYRDDIQSEVTMDDLFRDF
jgi:AAA+ ATPase superfamily predicted ATPase